MEKLDKLIDKMADEEWHNRQALMDEISKAISQLERLKEKCDKLQQIYDSDAITNATEINAYLNKCIVYQREIIRLCNYHQEAKKSR